MLNALTTSPKPACLRAYDDSDSGFLEMMRYRLRIAHKEIHDRLFADQPSIKERNWTAHAKALNLRLDDFEQCVKSGRYNEAVRQDMADGVRAGVRGTPTIVLENGDVVPGYLPAGRLRTALVEARQE